MKDDPIRHLLDEHRILLAEFAHLRSAANRLGSQGEAALPETLPVFKRIGQMMASQLHRHARKEDEVLFPAIEAIIGTDSPTAIMRQEHQDIYAQGVLLRETLYELNEVEHPQIEAGGALLRDLAANGGTAESLSVTGTEIAHLVEVHFEKEEQVLFPMAYNLLTDETMEAIAGTMSAIDDEAS